MQSIIQMKDVSLTRNQQQLLENIQWEVNEGEHWAILGLNGSGKTSLLNIINGYHFPTTGEVSILGKLFGKTNLHELRKEIGFVSSALDRFASMVNEETSLHVVISGKFASFGLYETYTEADEQQAVQLLQQLRLYYLKDRPFQQLSQGEQRRVLIARALMSNPKLLILDEPCSGLDVRSREQLLALVRNITTYHCHVIYVTHHIEEIVESISHVLLIKDGQIIAQGRKEELLTNALLSEAFNLSVFVEWKKERPFLSLA